MRSAITLHNKYWALVDHEDDVSEDEYSPDEFAEHMYSATYFDWDELDEIDNAIFEDEHEALVDHDEFAEHMYSATYFDWDELDEIDNATFEYEHEDLKDNAFFHWDALGEARVYELQDGVCEDEVYEPQDLVYEDDGECEDEMYEPQDGVYEDDGVCEDEMYEYEPQDGVYEDDVHQGKGDPFFDWDDLDEKMRKARCEMLRAKVRMLIMEMRMARSKHESKACRKDMRNSKKIHRQMKKMRKANMGNGYFDWDELDDREQASIEKKTSHETTAYFDWDELDKHEDEKVKEEIRAMKLDLTRSTANISTNDISKMSMIKEQRKRRREQSAWAMKAMKEQMRQKIHEACSRASIAFKTSVCLS